MSVSLFKTIQRIDTILNSDSGNPPPLSEKDWFQKLFDIWDTLILSRKDTTPFPVFGNFKITYVNKRHDSSGHNIYIKYSKLEPFGLHDNDFLLTVGARAPHQTTFQIIGDKVSTINITNEQILSEAMEQNQRHP